MRTKGYEHYSDEELWSDLPTRKPPKKRRGRSRPSGKKQYVDQLANQLSQQRNQPDPALVHRFMILQARVKQDWQIEVRLPKGKKKVFCFPPNFTVSVLRHFISQVNAAIQTDRDASNLVDTIDQIYERVTG